MRALASWLVLLLAIILPHDALAVTPMLAAGGGHTLALKNDGTAVAFGSDSFGQTGQGTSVQSAILVQAPGLNGVIAVSAGFAHTVALRGDGTVWSWGLNRDGEFGDGTQTPSSTPVPAQGLNGVTAIAAGMFHTAALKSDGTVWAWGYNDWGQIGPGADGTSRPGIPTQIPGVAGATKIASGQGHIVVLKGDGSVWAWGKNDAGQLGDGSFGYGITTIRSTPMPVAGLSGVIDIAAGANHTLAVKSDGTVWAWGSNRNGQLGDGTTADRASPIKVPIVSGGTAVRAGAGHTVVLKSDGTVLAWGANDKSQLGDGSTVDRRSPIQVPGLSGIAAIAAGLTHTVARKSDGTLLAWGSNEYGQLGDGTTTNHSSPAQAAQSLGSVADIGAGWNFTVAALRDGTVRAWGANGYGQLGGASLTGRSIPIAVQGFTGVTRIAASMFSSAALKSDGTVWIWGSYLFAPLTASAGSSGVPVQVPGLANVMSIASGVNFGVALKQDGSVWAWGSNGDGQLGDGTTNDRSTPVQVAGLSGITSIAAGWDHGLARRSDGTVWAWGRNNAGQVGIASQQDCRTLMQNRDACNPFPAQVPGLSGIIAIAGGEIHSVALKSDGTVWAWGSSNNSNGELGNRTRSFNSPGQVDGVSGVTAIAANWGYTVALKSDGAVWAWGTNSVGQFVNGTNSSLPAQVQGLTGMVAIAAGDGHAVAVKSDGTIWAWGVNDFGQLGDGTFVARVTPVLVVNESVDGFADLIPEIPNNVPTEKIPPFLVATYKSGSLSATSLYADLRGITASGTFASATRLGNSPAGQFAAGYNVYVAASVPSMQSAYFQLDSSNSWSLLSWPMAAFMRGVALDSQNTLVRAQILQNANLSQLPGASIIVGYGTDPDEMLRSARYRTIFTVPQQ